LSLFITIIRPLRGLLRLPHKRYINDKYIYKFSLKSDAINNFNNYKDLIK